MDPARVADVLAAADAAAAAVAEQADALADAAVEWASNLQPVNGSRKGGHEPPFFHESPDFYPNIDQTLNYEHLFRRMFTFCLHVFEK